MSYTEIELITRCVLYFVMAVLVLVGCGGKEARRDPAIGEAYVGPTTLVLRKEIAMTAASVGTLKHGDRLDILAQRRRFIRVRNDQGIEGWVDEKNLLSSEEMKGIREFSGRVRQLPTQGLASVNDATNVYARPSRQSPSFFLLKENEKFDVLGRRMFPHVPVKRKPLVPPPPKRPKSTKKKEPEPRIPPPPSPAAPKPPSNWMDISKTPESMLAQRKGPEPALREDWALIRNKLGQAGWILTRRMHMAVPDDIVTYAEGRRITAYFALSEVRDDGVPHNNWVWTTVGTGVSEFDYDQVRVFTYNVRRHRYETAYIDRKIIGFQPVLAREVKMPNLARARSENAAVGYPGFSLCLERPDGTRRRRDYAFIVNVVRIAGEGACEESGFDKVAATLAPQEQQAMPLAAQQEEPKTPFWQRMRGKWADLRSRVFGGDGKR